MDGSNGWYPDPARPGTERYWDGNDWRGERPEPDADRLETGPRVPLFSTVGFELPSREALIRMGADGAAGDAPEHPGRTRPRRRALKALSLVVGAAVVTSGSFVIAGRHSDADAAVVAAVRSALADRSADISLTGTGSADGNSFSLSGSGSIDFTQDTMQASITLADGSQQVDEKVIYLNQVAYVNLGSALDQIVPGKSWVSLTLRQLSSSGGTSPFGSTDTLGSDPSDALTTLRQEGNAATELGSSTVDGVRVEGYAVHITKPDLDYKVYVDDAGQLVRLTTDIHSALAGQSVSVADTVDFSNYGATVSVTPPPAGQVASWSSFLKAAASLASHSASVE